MTQRFFSLLWIPLFIWACSTQTPEQAAPQSPEADIAAEQAGFVPGQLFIKVSEEYAGEEVPEVDFSAFGAYTVCRTFPPSGKFEARHRAAGLHRWYTVTFSEERPQTKAAADLKSLPGVELAEPVPVLRSKAEPYPFDDPRLPSLWGLYNPGGKTQWTAGCDINALKAWEIETGKPEVVVAVIDSGVDYNHEDLHQNMWTNEAELNGLPGEDDDNNGFIDDIYGFNFVARGEAYAAKITPEDHGTHVAGTIAGVSNNGIGVAGVAGGNGSPDSGVRIMCVQMMDGSGSGSYTAAAIVYAADNGAVVGNCSWGNVNNEAPTSSALVQAIDYFNAYAGMDTNGDQVGPMAGGVLFFAAGNDGREVEHPAMDDNVFAVAALGANFVRSYFTSYGDWVDISAPGGDANKGVYILSCLPDNQYGNFQGSSMAAPHVTGTAALVVSHYGVGKKGFTRDKLINLLQGTANTRALDENGSYATKLGAGLVDAYAALVAGDDQEPLPVSTLSASARSNFITVEWTVPGSEEVRAPYCFNLFYSTSSLSSLDPENPAAGVEMLRVLSYGVQIGSTLSATLDKLDFDTNYHFRIQSESVTGMKSALSPEVTAITGDNNPPVITPLDGTSLVLRSFETGFVRFQVSDADGHDVSVETRGELKGLTARVQDGLVVLTVDAIKAGAGTFNGVLAASDGYAETAQTFSYTVKPNSAPTTKGSIPDQVFDGTSDGTQIDLSQYFTDADGEPLSYEVNSSSTSIIVDAAIEGEMLSLKAHSLGTTTLTVTASDALGETAALSFRVLVRSGDTPLELYPNPVKDYLNIRTGQSASLNVQVVSSLGSVMFEGAVQASPFAVGTVDFRSFPGGVYTVVVEMGGETYKRTVVKQ